MGKRGPKPKGAVKIKWSANFAYAIGLITTDGCLYRDGRHICLTSKDLEQVNNFNTALGTKYHLGRKGSGIIKDKKYYIVQFSDVIFYKFLNKIGLFSAKSKTMGKIEVPDKYFFDFLRGSFDGDGCTNSYWDPRWKSSFMFYTTFISASGEHIKWLRSEISNKIAIKGHVTKSGNGACFQLKYAKKESLILLKKMYYSSDVLHLSRKKLKINKMLGIVGKSIW